jgi:hypothetical protein
MTRVQTIQSGTAVNKSKLKIMDFTTCVKLEVGFGSGSSASEWKVGSGH